MGSIPVARSINPDDSVATYTANDLALFYLYVSMVSRELYTLPMPTLPPPNENNLWYLDRNTDSVIVFVHGILSDSGSCWLDEKRGVSWPELIINDKSFDEYSIFLGGYYTAVDAGPYDVAASANELFNALKRNIDGSPSVLSRKKIMFVWHSTGGIFVRYMLDSMFPHFVKSIVGLVLIASPSYGSKWATRLGLLTRFYKNKLGIQLEWGNWSLEDIDDRFKRLQVEERIPGLVGHEAYENHFIIHRRFWFPLRLLVPKESAGRYFGPPELLRNTNHFTTVKPHKRKHPSYEMLGDFLTEVKKKEAELLSKIIGNQRSAIVEASSPPEIVQPVLTPVAASQETGQARAPINVNGMLAAEERQELRKKRRTVGKALVVFAVCFSCGYLFGKIYSFDYTDPREANYYLRARAEWRQLDAKHGELSVRAGTRVYKFTTGDARPTYVNVPPSQLDSNLVERIQRKLDDHDRAAAFILPALAAGGGTTVTVLNRGARITETEAKIVLLVGAVTGGSVGFVLGSMDKGNVDTPIFQDELGNDTQLWAEYERIYRQVCHGISAKQQAETNLRVLKELHEKNADDLTKLEADLNREEQQYGFFMRHFMDTHQEMKQCLRQSDDTTR